MEKELENSVSLDTGKICTACHEGTILEKITRKIIRRIKNGIFGPGGSNYAETEIVVIYFCGDCGQPFLPTKINGLDEDLPNHKNAILALLENSTPVVLNRSLGCGEVFEKIVYEDKQPENVRITNNDQHFFEQGSVIRTISNKRGFQKSFDYHKSWERDFDSNPYLVPNSTGNDFELVWWAKKSRSTIPLSKLEGQKKLILLKHELAGIKLKIKPKKASSIKIISNGYELEIESIKQEIDKIKAGTQTKDSYAGNPTLPEGSVMAKLVKVVDPKSFKIRSFYIPENYIK